MIVASSRKLHRYCLSALVVVALVGGYYWFTTRSAHESIHVYDPALDRAALVKIFTSNMFWLTNDEDERHAIESFERGLDNRAMTRALSGERNLSTYVYRDAEATKGFVSFYRISWSKARILYIAVDDAYRRRGYAETLMQFALDELKRQGFSSVELTTRVINQRAQGLYKKFGFRQSWDDGTLVAFERVL